MKKILLITVMLSIYSIALCQNCQCVIVGENNRFNYSLADSCYIPGLPEDIITNNEFGLVVDSITDAYFIADIITSKNDCFLVNFMATDENSHFSRDSVWVSKNNVAIGLRGAFYKGERIIPLYNSPDYDGGYESYIIDTANILAPVLECNDGWAKIRLNIDGTFVVGWLAPENQCINMYTMCMGE